MRKIKYVTVGTIIVCLLVTGCSKSNINVNIDTVIKSSTTIDNENLKQDMNLDTFRLTVWNDSFDKNEIERVFKEIYPNAEINVVSIHGTGSQKIINALAEGNAPDVLIYYSNELGNFNAVDGFENLAQAKYKGEELKPLFNQEEWAQSMSFDGKKLIALPFTQGPVVTYYRKDILEQYGIPTDPDELGNFMEKPEGLMKIAKDLKKDNKWVIQWKDELIKININSYGCFDKDMKLTVYNEKMKEALKLSKEAYDLGLIGNNDIWTEHGRKAVKDGNIPMLYLNKWGADYIKEIAPETAGKWRATRLPLGLYGYEGTNSISIVSSSKHKMQAWELVKKLITKDKVYDANIRDQEKEFLGNQKANMLYENLVNKMPRRYHTMLDDKVYQIIIDNFNININSYPDMEAIVDSNKLKINNAIYREQKILSDYLIENRKP